MEVDGGADAGTIPTHAVQGDAAAQGTVPVPEPLTGAVQLPGI